MHELLSVLSHGQVSAGALLGLWILLVFFGKLPTPGQMRDLRDQLRRALEEGEKWHEAADKQLEVSTKLGMTVEKILPYVEMTNHAIVDIRELALRRAIPEADDE